MSFGVISSVVKCVIWKYEETVSGKVTVTLEKFAKALGVPSAELIEDVPEE